MRLRQNAFHADDAHMRKRFVYVRIENVNSHWSAFSVVRVPPLKVQCWSIWLWFVFELYVNPLLYLGHLGLGNWKSRPKMAKKIANCVSYAWHAYLMCIEKSDAWPSLMYTCWILLQTTTLSKQWSQSTLITYNIKFQTTNWNQPSSYSKLLKKVMAKTV